MHMLNYAIDFDQKKKKTMLLMHEWSEQTHQSFSLSLLDSHQPASPVEHHPSGTQMLALPLFPASWRRPYPKKRITTHKIAIIK